MNSFSFVGRLATDVEYENPQIGCVRFSVAVPRRWSKVPEQRKKADFICCKAYHAVGEFIKEHFNVGQEIACDARVLQLFPQARRQYGLAMLKAQLAPCVLPATCHWGLIHPFKERIQMLRTPAPGALRWLTGLALVGTLCFGFGVTAWSAQPASARSAAPAAATAQPRLGRVTLRLLNATPAEAAREAAEAIGVQVVGLDAFKNSERKINFSFIDSDAQMVFMLIAEEADVNVAFGEKKVTFSTYQ